MESPVALRSARWHGFFRHAFARHARGHMRALRVARWGQPGGQAPALPPGPLVVFANHPSWWDGVSFMLLSDALFPGRPIFVPMQAAALARYPFMRRIGAFPVEQGTARGAAAFLRAARDVLADPRHMLWVNAPGRFCDVRERPVPVMPGLARLPEIAPTASFLPLALDYPFWSEAKPEMLAAFGPAIPAATLLAEDREARPARLAAALEATMDRLAQDAIARDPSRFKDLLRGTEGMGGIYQLWRRLGAALRGRRFDPRHDPRAEGP